MPFDPPPASRTRLGRQRTAVAIWLFVLCGMVFVMVVLGGATRLTGSGLSIMEWAPLSGTLPPLSHAEWQRLFALYQAIPQYRLLHAGMGLAGFQGLFWLEWVHRLWGRAVGAALLLPLVAFAWRGAITRRLGLRLAALFALGGLQGAVGWFMVASGFQADATAVAAWRLVLHLSLALSLYAVLLWTALSTLRPVHRATAPRWLRIGLCTTLAAVGLTIVAGGFTAGLHAGLDYETFPLMDGRLIPRGYAALTPFARNLVANVAAVQFDHRLLATLTAALALATAAAGWRAAPPLRPAFGAIAAVVLLQYALGVATLLNAVPVPLAIAHQANAVLLLTACLIALHRATRTQEFS